MPLGATTAMPLSLQIFIAIFIVGAFLRSRDLMTKSHTERAAQFVFMVSLPATILVSLDHVPLAPTVWKLPLAACFITLPMVACTWLLTAPLQLARNTQGGFLLATGSINSVYFAFPVILSTFGDEGLTHAVLFDLGQTTLTLTVLYGVALWHGAKTLTPRSVAIRFLSSPPLWALVCILAVKLSGYHLPAWLLGLLQPLHLTTTPLASLVLGLSISFSAVRKTVRLATLGVLVRIGGGLLLGWATVGWLSLTGMERAVVLFVAAMPSAVSTVIIAAETGLDEELVASIVALSICFGIVMLPWLPELAILLMK